MKRAFFLTTLLVSCSASDTKPPREKPNPQPLVTCDAKVRSSVADSVAGEFTDWANVELIDGVATFEDLEPGEYAYALMKDGEVLDTLSDGPTKWWEGTEYSRLAVADCGVPALEVVSAEIVDETLRAELSFRSAVDGARVDPSSVTVRVGGETVEPEVDAATGAIVVERALPDYGKYTIEVSAKSAEGVDAEPVWLPIWHDPAPWTWRDASMYLIFTDRFRDTDGEGTSTPDGVEPIAGYKGGDFAGVEQAIEEGYFEALGVDTLWLSPVYDNPTGGYLGSDGSYRFTGYHGYWPIDSVSAEPNLGGDEALTSLVEAAHERGMRIVFDIVLNHVHEDHGYCSENPDWCEQTCVCGTDNCAWEGENSRQRDCQFAPYLPDLDYRNHDIVTRVVDDVFALVRKFDVDGLRIDAAKHMDKVILRHIRARTDAIEESGGAPFWLVGETFTGDRGLIMEYVSDDQLHGQFDFPLYYAIRGAFAYGGSLRDLEAAAAESERAYGSAYTWMSPFLGNHDVERFVSAAAGNVEGGFGNTPDLMAQGGEEVTQWDLVNRTSMAYAFLLTQPGVPLLYYGDEVGLAGGPDPDNRRMMPSALSANQLELLGRVQQLGQIRRAVPVLRHGGREELWLGDDLYVYVRDGAPGDAAIIALNRGGPVTETISIPTALGLDGATLESRNSDREVRVIDGQIVLELDPWEYAIFTPK